MNDYKQVIIRTDAVSADWLNDVLASMLAEIGFDSFEETGRGIIAYCPASLFDIEQLKSTLCDIPNIDSSAISFSVNDIEDRNWNEVWEQNGFEPIVIDDRCIVHSTDKKVESHCEYDIIINPVQSFGSGTHNTTQMILRYLLDNEITEKCVLDMGCGTAILSIMASKRGAKTVTAIDIDEWSVRNALSNSELNGCSNISVHHGDATLLSKLNEKYDLVLANINRNILLADMEKYVAQMNDSARLILSGFYEEDISILTECATRLQLKYISTTSLNEWRMIELKKAVL